MNKLLFVCILLMALASCSRNDSTTNGGSFTPPTTNYLALDTKEHDSASAFGIYEPGIPDFNVRQATFTNAPLTAPITSVYGFSLQIEALQYTLASQNPYYRDMHDSIPEGQYKKYTLAGVDGGAHKQGFWMYATAVVSETYTTQVGSSSQADGYYLTGNLYISKLNGKLRYTSDGPITVTNTNNPVLKHTFNFSIAEDAGTF